MPSSLLRHATKRQFLDFPQTNFKDCENVAKITFTVDSGCLCLHQALF